MARPIGERQRKNYQLSFGNALNCKAVAGVQDEENNSEIPLFWLLRQKQI